MSNKRALLVAHRLPEFDRESGSRRIFDAIEFLREAGWQVTFAAKTISGGERYIKILQQRGVETLCTSEERLNQLIAGGSFELAYFAFWFMAEEFLPLIRKHSPTTRVIVDSIDLQFLRNSRAIFCRTSETAADADTAPPGLLDTNYANEFVREVNAYAAADAVLTVSQKESEWINDLMGDPALAYVVPDNEDIPEASSPFSDRKGILFVGNFWHRPNVDAVRYLCQDILPRLDQSILADHPVYIVGHALKEEICDYGKGLPNVRFVGWVPSVLPYLQQARASVIPLRYGAGTKRKIIQSLMVGTPTVTTSIGAEGLNLVNEEHALISDDPDEFARAVERLLGDDELWRRLHAQGRELVLATHGRQMVREKFLQVTEEVLAKKPKPLMEVLPAESPGQPKEEYGFLVTRIRKIVNKILPADAKIIVVSKGDEELLKLEGRHAVHFPQNENGEYAGYYPANSAEVVGHLKELKSGGGKFLLLPQSAFWWLDYYADFKQHLDASYHKLWEDSNCIIYELSAAPPDAKLNGQAAATTALTPELIDRMRPVAAAETAAEIKNGNSAVSGPRPKVLVLGIYLANRPNNADDTVAIFSDSKNYDVVQRWVAIGGAATSGDLADVTVDTIYQKVPKFEILNRLLEEESDLDDYEYILISDDDVILPKNFLDQYLALQTKLGFVLAQPARTNDSYLDHPIVEQQWGTLARRTRFVEIGPVFSFHKSIYGLLLPFDLTSPMGWGYENVWAYQLAQREMKMGIIDALPIAHTLRKPVENYSWDEANKNRDSLLKTREHFRYEDCFRVLDVISLGGDR